MEADNDLEGKLVRLEIGPATGPVVVNSNFVAKGLRNPWGTSIDRGDTNDVGRGDIWISDTGSDRPGELHYLPAIGGAPCPGPSCTNYGWPFWHGVPGTAAQNAQGPCHPAISTNCGTVLPQMALSTPFYSVRNNYDPNPQLGALIGGQVYRGTVNPSLAGRYVYAMWTSSSPRVAIYSFLPSAGPPIPPPPAFPNGQGHAGDLEIGATWFNATNTSHPT